MFDIILPSYVFLVIGTEQTKRWVMASEFLCYHTFPTFTVTEFAQYKIKPKVYVL